MGNDKRVKAEAARPIDDEALEIAAGGTTPPPPSPPKPKPKSTGNVVAGNYIGTD